MGKIKVQSLLKKEIRAVIPYRDEEGNEQKIIIKNPSEALKRQTLKDFADGRNEDEILGFLFSQLTNIELNLSLEELKTMDLSYELECVFYHMTCILNEIIATVRMETDLAFRMESNKQFSDNVDKVLDKKMN